MLHLIYDDNAKGQICNKDANVCCGCGDATHTCYNCPIIIDLGGSG